MSDIEYDDDITMQPVFESLWNAVLLATIEDAILGAPCLGNTKTIRIRETYQARNYITKPNPDFDMVCSLAGLDPEAVRERVIPRIEAAPTPEELIAGRKPPKLAVKSSVHRRRKSAPGVEVSTGGGSQHRGWSPTLRLPRGPAGEAPRKRAPK